MTKTQNQKKRAHLITSNAKGTKIPVMLPPKKRQRNGKQSVANIKSAGGIGQSGGIAASYAQVASVKTFMQKGMALKGTDLLFVVSPTSNIPDSSVLAEFSLNPLQLSACARLKQFAPLWDKFKFIALRICYAPACGTDTQGLLAVSGDPDKLDGYSQLTGVLLDKKMSASLHNVSAAPNLPFCLAITDKKFFGGSKFMEPKISSDPRNYTAGKLVITNQGALTAGTYGRFYLQWEIYFEEPNIDEEYDAATLVLDAVDSSLNSVQYPWGNYSLAKVSPLSIAAYQPVNYADVYSDVTLGSVIKFFYPGQYLVTISRTGAGMGIGAFTAAVFTGCSPLWTLANLGQGPNSKISNGASTASMWTVAVTVTTANATMSSTNDTSVTHTYSWTTVSFVAENPEVDLDLQAKLVGALESMGLNMNSLRLKSPPRVNAIGPNSIVTGTVRSGDGPAKTISEVATGSTLGSATDPIFVEPYIPPRLEKERWSRSPPRPCRGACSCGQCY